MAQERDNGWKTAGEATAVAALVSQAIMPRVYYSDPQVTTGWKARWHVSVLAPVATYLVVAGLNEMVLKDAFADPRPGCDGTSTDPSCSSNGMMSTAGILGGSAVGHGTATFLVDTFVHSGGSVNAWSLLGGVVTPLILGTFSAVSMSASGYESGEQILAGNLTGLASGLVFGGMYSLLQVPRCGYGGDVVCW